MAMDGSREHLLIIGTGVSRRTRGRKDEERGKKFEVDGKRGKIGRSKWIRSYMAFVFPCMEPHQ